MRFTRREPVLVLIFSIITCGIYFLYWIYQVTKELGMFLQNENNPALELILCLFCAPYTIYWFYKMGQQVYQVQMSTGNLNPQDNSVLYIILTIFGLSCIAGLILQGNLNDVNA